jgi:16S rRNA (cytosine1402-N4)-methyltransferase
MNDDSSTPNPDNTPSDAPGNTPGDPQKPHRRRARYGGTHPRRFEERYKELQADAYPETIEHLRAKGKTPVGTHVSVLVAEVVKALQPAPGEAVADCTLGFGGHALEFMKQIGTGGRLIGFDVDASAIAKARPRLETAGVPFSLYHSNFAGIGNVLGSEKLAAYDVIFADLGVSSMQVDDPARGFSYKHDGPLDMRMDERMKRTAAELVATLAEAGLAEAMTDLADEPDAAAIARAIVEERRRQPITQTADLVRVIFRAKGLTRRAWREQAAAEPGTLHPAALVFQALRMLVNDETARIKHLLRSVPMCLAPGGRVGIISFHSGEDRLVKLAFREGQRAGIYEAVAEDPIRPTAEEVRANPRSASAKLRWARKTK